MRLHTPAAIATSPLLPDEVAIPEPGPGQLLLKVEACGVCHTDLHIAEGELQPSKYPIIPGHQAVGRVISIGAGVHGWTVGSRAGIPWLHSACGLCAFCLRGEENLCPRAQFTGLHLDGGFAEYILAEAAFALPLPTSMEPASAAPLLCAGIIGYRSLRKADVLPCERVGLIGFGASAHLSLQIARHWGCHVWVFSRSLEHRRLAESLGAEWTGVLGENPPGLLDRAVLFAPNGALVPAVLDLLRPGGTLAINAIQMTPIPPLDYRKLYWERTLRSVANATRADAEEFLKLAAMIPVRTIVKTFPLADANDALRMLNESQIDGAAVLVME